jgi:hypothetical protein
MGGRVTASIRVLTDVSGGLLDDRAVGPFKSAARAASACEETPSCAEFDTKSVGNGNKAETL